VGRLLTDRGYRVQFLLLDPRDPPEGSSAKTQRDILKAYGVIPEAFDGDRMNAFAPDVIVDALFGTGLGRPLSGRAAVIADIPLLQHMAPAPPSSSCILCSNAVTVGLPIREYA
jgi:NAD(P)H-hydrate repair Nnr-like enzyme with NAD(P)H-hydrate epimerase domain